jgi:hypothetical protein
LRFTHPDDVIATAIIAEVNAFINIEPSDQTKAGFKNIIEAQQQIKIEAGGLNKSSLVQLRTAVSLFHLLFGHKDVDPTKCILYSSKFTTRYVDNKSFQILSW